MATTLASTFNATHPLVVDAGLEERLTGFVTKARDAWPGIFVDDAVFVAHVANALPGELRSSDALDALHGADLYLTCACGRGAPHALATLDREFLSRLEPAILRIHRAHDFVDEVIQRLRERLFVGDRPRINEYTGRGPLAGWLRVAAIRAALNARRGARPSETLRSVGGGGDPELEAINGQYKAEVELAFKTALARIDAADRELLRAHYIEGVNFEKLAPRYGVDRSTISRRVAAIRRFVLTETRRELVRLVPMTEASRDSLLIALRSRLEVSLDSALKT